MIVIEDATVADRGTHAELLRGNAAYRAAVAA